MDLCGTETGSDQIKHMIQNFFWKNNPTLQPFLAFLPSSPGLPGNSAGNPGNPAAVKKDEFDKKKINLDKQYLGPLSQKFGKTVWFKDIFRF